jgi:BlaI family transcriptional regulator, penicillinase repressor
VGDDTLTELQLAVMKVLWGSKEATVADVGTALGEQGRELAPTTVATLLQRLVKQGWVKHRKRGRVYVYRAGVDRAAAATGVLRRVMRLFFDGKVSALAAQLLEAEDLSAQEIEQLKQIIARKAE